MDSEQSIKSLSTKTMRQNQTNSIQSMKVLTEETNIY